MELFRNANYNFLGWKWAFVGVSLLLCLVGLSSLLARGGPRYGIDFRGGTLVYVKFQQPPSLGQLRNALKTKGLGESTIQRYGPVRENEVIIGLEQKEQTGAVLGSGTGMTLEAMRATILETLRETFAGDQRQKADLNNLGRDTLLSRLVTLGLGDQEAAELADGIVTRRVEKSGLLGSVADLRGLPGLTPQLEQTLDGEFFFAPYAVRNAEFVGPKVGAALRRQALYATLYALTGMLIYIAFRFEFVYGVAAVIATLHDVMITIGVASLFHIEVSLTVVAALLTLVGFSVNDSIVVFDRIRENLKLMRREGLAQVVNRSINQTLSRTILTSGLTFITVLSLFLFGGAVLHGFAFVLVVGVLVGTYSSIGIAAPIVVVWQQWYQSRGGRGRVVTLEKARTRAKPGVSAGVRA